MPTTQVPDFTPLAQQKLEQLQERGFVDFGGFVGWWRPGMTQEKEHAHADQ